MKKILSLILAGLLAFSCLSMVSFAENTTPLFKDGNFTFFIQNDLAYITNIDAANNGSVHITSSVCCDDDRVIGTYELDGFVDDDNDAPDTFGTEYVFIGGMLSDALDDIAEDVKTIDIPKYLTDFEIKVFYDLPNLETINVNENNADFASYNGVIYNKEKTTLLFHPRANVQTTALSTVTSIASKAFYYNSKLTSFTIPADVTAIPDYCFESCSSLTAVDMSAAAITQIGKYAFTASALTGITLGSSMKTVSNFAFYNCASLSNMSIDEGVSNLDIKTGAFLGCPITAVTIPRGVTTIADKAIGYYYDNEYNLQKYATEITGYKYNSDRTATTPAYNYASANAFTFVPLDIIYSVKYSYPFLNGREATMYLYDKKTLKYSVDSSTGEFQLDGVAPGKYNIYFRGKFGTLVQRGSVAVVNNPEKEVYEFNTKLTEPIGEVVRDGTIDIQDVQAVLAAGVYGSSNSDYDVDLNGIIDMGDISVILYGKNFAKSDAEIKDSFTTPIIPM